MELISISCLWSCLSLAYRCVFTLHLPWAVGAKQEGCPLLLCVEGIFHWQYQLALGFAQQVGPDKCDSDFNSFLCYNYCKGIYDSFQG